MVREINRCKHYATTPSGCACHPSTGGELAVRYFFNSPSVSVLVISSPQEGNCPPLPVVREINRCKHYATTPSGCACHPSTGGELAVRYFFNSPSVSVLVISPPQEGNCPPLPVVREINRCKHYATTPSGCACHPSTGGELAVRYFFNSPSVSVLVISPPQEGNCPPLR